MEINWLGGSALLLKGRQARVVLDPGYEGRGEAPGAGQILVAPASGQNRLGADHAPQVVGRPGEYEISGVSVRGSVSKGVSLFAAEVDEVTVCGLVDLPRELETEALEALGAIDVLAVSLLGGASERAREVVHLVSQLQPAILVPVGYRPGTEGEPGELAPLIKEMGLSQVTPQPRLNLSGGGGGGDDTRVVVLEPRG